LITSVFRYIYICIFFFFFLYLYRCISLYLNFYLFLFTFFFLLFASGQNLVTHVGTAPQDALAQAAQLELGQNPNALAIRRPFDPTAHELEANFRLTR
jgi:hypothetical protein